MKRAAGFNRRNYPDDAGSVILLAIFLVFFLGLIIGSYQFIARSDLEIAVNHLKTTQALYCADAGIEEVVFQLRSENKCGSYQTAITSPATCPGTPANCNCYSTLGGEQSQILGKYGATIINSGPKGYYYNYGASPNNGLIKTVNATGTVGVYSKSVQAVLKVSPFRKAGTDQVRCQVLMRSWKEVY